jgi:membrane peptidoglycan carboxypeptidase
MANSSRPSVPKLAWPSLRRRLICLHNDLFDIQKKVERRFWRDYVHGDQRWVRADDLTNIEKLVIVLEDRRFSQHHGVDRWSVLREIIRAITFRRHGGASTIDMQFVRTVTGYRSLTFRRKLYEILLALIINFRYDKRTILRSYLACAFLGSHLIGITRASYGIYGKAVEELSIEEAAFISAMLVYPRPRSEPLTWKAKVTRRAKYGIGVYLANKERFDKLPI